MIEPCTLSMFVKNNASLLSATLILMLMDVVTGLLKAFYTKSFASSVMRDGLYHKAGFIMMIALAIICEVFIEGAQLSVQFTIPTCGVVCVYIMLCEFASVVENLSQINPHLAKLTSKYLVKVPEPNQEEE